MNPFLRGVLLPVAVPLVPLYALAQAVRRRWTPAPRPMDGSRVICIGNHTLGGTGKTEVVRALVQALRARMPVAVVSRGYGRLRRGDEPLILEPPAMTADPRVFGDEPVMLCRETGVPVFVGADRARAIAAAVSRGIRAVVADDGFQNPTFHKDVSVLVLSAPAFSAPQALFPLGDLREPLRSALARADLVVLNHADQVSGALRASIRRRLARWRPAVPIVETAYRLRGIRRLSDGARCAPAQVQHALLVTGVGSPALVERVARDAGINLVRHIAYRDHRWFTPADIGGWMIFGQPVVTTPKDAVRIAAVLPSGHPARERIWIMEIELVIREGADAWQRLIAFP